MCLIFFSLQKHPVYKLIIAANRDEFYNRKTAAAGYWSDHPEILGGRDLEAQGTWMGMSKQGKIALITNYRDPKNINPNAPSRGQLVSQYLSCKTGPEDYLKSISKNSSAYNGFNLLVGDVDELWYFSNYREGIERIRPGHYGLSNHLLETPWPKVEKGKKKFEELLKSEKLQPEPFFEMLYDDAIEPDESLPETGVGIERERMLSSMFIKSPNYGTRCSTVVMIDQSNQMVFSERIFNLTTFEYTTKTFCLSV